MRGVDDAGGGELTEDELRERLAGPAHDGRFDHSLESELPIGPEDDGGGRDQGPATTSRGTGGRSMGGTTGGAIDAPVSGEHAAEEGSLEEEAVPEDVERLRRRHH